MKTLKLTIFHIILPILIGGLIYISFRSSTLKMFGWLDHKGTNDLVNWLRNITIPLRYIIPSWIYFSLPDGLWVYSFTSAFLILWSGRINLWLLIPFITGVFVELAQWNKIFQGTFDILDLAFSIAAYLLSILIFTLKYKKNERKHES